MYLFQIMQNNCMIGHRNMPKYVFYFIYIFLIKFFQQFSELPKRSTVRIEFKKENDDNG